MLDGVTRCSIGADRKYDVDLSVDARVIHDLSFLPGDSVNDSIVLDHEIEISCDGVETLSNLISKLQCMMMGDVNGAFRHIPVSGDEVGRFAGTIPKLGILIIDLCCPIAWKYSPSSYWVAGTAINHLNASSAPRWPQQPTPGRENFDAKAWCDDHTAIEQDMGSRLAEAQMVLRSAMVAILGPEVCNEKKFTPWFVR
ncbi:Hypothetical protein PHPALM_20552, partial [Phytophthora palmivora]